MDGLDEELDIWGGWGGTAVIYRSPTAWDLNLTRQVYQLVPYLCTYLPLLLLLTLA